MILSKPIIVLLLLVTTYAGMVVGGKSCRGRPGLLDPAGRRAGGRGFLGPQPVYRSRNRQGHAANRQTPAARRPPEPGRRPGLWIGACLAAFFLLAGMVNLLAAVLSFAGMVYYVLLYSIWLKRMTVQNIVIGGGAGAIPPLVGGPRQPARLNIPSLFLFAIIFLWTPPHFWALAIVRTKDYARGRVPMLPVIRGEKETRARFLSIPSSWLL